MLNHEVMSHLCQVQKIWRGHENRNTENQNQAQSFIVTQLQYVSQMITQHIMEFNDNLRIFWSTKHKLR